MKFIAAPRIGLGVGRYRSQVVRRSGSLSERRISFITTWLVMMILSLDAWLIDA
jgi:hypothetical protein